MSGRVYQEKATGSHNHGKRPIALNPGMCDGGQPQPVCYRDLCGYSGRPLEESASASWVPTGSHLVALSSDRALVCPIGSAILPDLLDHPCTRSPLEARSSWSVPQSISADLSRSGLRFKLQQSQNSLSPWLCPSPPLRPHDTYPAGPTRNSHTILGCCLSTLALIFGANHAIRLFSETPCRRRHSLLPILPFFLGRLIIFHSMLVIK